MRRQSSSARHRLFGSFESWLHPLSVAVQRADHAQVRVATAEKLLRVQAREDLLLRRARVLVDVHLAVEHDSADAVGALSGLLLDEGCLYWVRVFLGAQSLDRGHLVPVSDEFTCLTQDRIGAPSSKTVQAPHCARPHPNLGPFN